MKKLVRNTSYYVVNAITIYRIAASAVLLALIIAGKQDIFKWMLAISFFTDAIDGYLARRYKVVSKLGSRLDSIGDDLTVLMGIIAIIVFQPGFFRQLPVLIFTVTMFVLLLVQVALAIHRYGKLTSFHTYLAKIAAVLQGSFLVLFFFLPDWPTGLFYLAAIFTTFDLVEEIILILMLPEWRKDVKGIYWVQKRMTGRAG